MIEREKKGAARPAPEPAATEPASLVEGAALAAPVRFEEALNRLEELVLQLETGELPLEETIERFEEGQRLVGICNQLLARAELRVKEILRRADGSVEERPLDETPDDPTA